MKLRRIFRRLYSGLSLALICLVVVPWSVVVLTHLRVRLMPPIPKINVEDSREMVEIVMGLESLRSRFGSFPPDFTSGNPVDEIDDYLKREFPRRDRQGDMPANVSKLGPEHALSFWLSGMFEDNPMYPLTGRVPDEALPRTEEEIEEIILETDMMKAMAKTVDKDELWRTRQYKQLEATYRRTNEMAYANFEKLKTRKPVHWFVNPRLSKKGTYRPSACFAPLIYFQSKNYETASFRGLPEWGVARPYEAEASTAEDRRFVKPVQFQIINAGRDGRYGTESVRAVDAGFYDDHCDNMVSFSSIPLGMVVRSEELDKAKQVRTMTIYMALVCTFIYPVVAALRWQNDDGIALLALSVKQQWAGSERSPYWSRILRREKSTRRANAIDRFATAERKRVRANRVEPPKFARKKGGKDAVKQILLQRNRLE